MEPKIADLLRELASSRQTEAELRRLLVSSSLSLRQQQSAAKELERILSKRAHLELELWRFEQASKADKG
jgi:hypothetical protein